MKKSIAFLFFSLAAFTIFFSRCSKKETTTNPAVDSVQSTPVAGKTRIRKKSETNEACSDKAVAIDSKSIVDKRWVHFPNVHEVLLFNSDQTCILDDLRGEGYNKTLIGTWSLQNDTLKMVFNDVGTDPVVASVTNLTEHDFSLRVIKEPFGFWSYLTNVSGDYIYNFTVDEVHEAFSACDFIGQWAFDSKNDYTQPYLYDFRQTNVCKATGLNNQSEEGFDGTWKFIDDRIIFNWKKEYKGRKYSDDGYETLLELDTLNVNTYDTLHILKATGHTFDTREHGTFVRTKKMR